MSGWVSSSRPVDPGPQPEMTTRIGERRARIQNAHR